MSIDSDYFVNNIIRSGIVVSCSFRSYITVKVYFESSRKNNSQFSRYTWLTTMSRFFFFAKVFEYFSYPLAYRRTRIT